MFGMYLMAIGRPKGEAIICAAMVGALALLGVLEMVTDSIKMDICSRYEQAL